MSVRKGTYSKPMGSYFAAFAPDCAYAAWVAIQKLRIRTAGSCCSFGHPKIHNSLPKRERERKRGPKIEINQNWMPATTITTTTTHECVSVSAVWSLPVRNA